DPWGGNIGPASTSLPLLPPFIALVDRQKSILHRQGQDAHGGAVARADAVAADPGAVVALVVEESLEELGLVIFPVVAAELEHRLRAIIDAIEEVPVAPAHGIALQIVGGLERFPGTVEILAANLEAQNAGAGARDGQTAAGGVGETPAIGLAAAQDGLDGLVDRLAGRAAGPGCGGSAWHWVRAAKAG